MMKKRNLIKIITFLSTFLVSANYVLAGVPDLAIPATAFVKNEGRLDSEVAFNSRLLGGEVFVTRHGKIVYSLPVLPADVAGRQKVVRRISIVEELIGAHTVTPSAGEILPTKVSYIVGKNPEKWQIAVPTYETVRMPQVWDEIDLTLKAYSSNIEKLFVLHPGADPKRVKLKLSGIEKLKIGTDGALLAQTGRKAVAFTKPKAWQMVDGKRTPVDISYSLNDEQASVYGFVVGDYAPELTLYIDPLLQSSFLGGSGTDRGIAISTAPDGDVYVLGSVWSTTDFPGTSGGADTTSVGDEAFIAKLSGDLKSLRQATYFGGGQGDRPNDLALAENGDVIVVGETHSDDLPGVTGGLDETLNGTWDGFVARFNSGLTTLLQSTYLGGGQDDAAWAVLTQSGDKIVVAGTSNSSDFPGVSGGAYAIPKNTDTFVTRLDGDLKTVEQSTFFGGSGFERPYDLEVGSNGDLYIAGFTDSSDMTDITGGAQTVSHGYNEGFIARIAGDLKSVEQATYLGGPAAAEDGKEGSTPSAETYIRAMAISADGGVYVGGDTNSDQIPGVANGAVSNQRNGFLSLLTADLKTITQSTYIGGTNNGGDVYGLAFLANGDLLSVGFGGDGSGFPALANGDDTSGVADAYVSRIAADLKSIKQSTMLGGDQGYEEGCDIATTAQGAIYVVGTTSSSDFHKIDGGADSTFDGSSEGYVALFDSLKATNVAPADNCTFFVIKAKNGKVIPLCL